MQKWKKRIFVCHWCLKVTRQSISQFWLIAPIKQFVLFKQHHATKFNPFFLSVGINRFFPLFPHVWTVQKMTIGLKKFAFEARTSDRWNLHGWFSYTKSSESKWTMLLRLISGKLVSNLNNCINLMQRFPSFLHSRLLWCTDYFRRR